MKTDPGKTPQDFMNYLVNLFAISSSIEMIHRNGILRLANLHNMRSLLLAIAFANISPGSASGISADLDKTSSASLIPRVEVVKTQPYTPDRQYDAAYDASVQLTVTILNNRSSLLYGYVTAIDPSTGAYMNLYRENTQAPYIWKPKPNGTSAIPKYFTSGLGQYEIQLPAGRNSTVFLPGYATSGRVYIASDHLQFGTTAGGPAEGLVEPSVSNPSLPEHNIAYQFLEFTYLKDSFYADISNMDFISLPLGMTVVSSNATSTVPGLVANATELICEALEKQTARDAFSWAKFCVRHESTNDLLRVLSPTQYLALYPSDNLSTYFDPYVDQGKYHFPDRPDIALVLFGIRLNYYLPETLTLSSVEQVQERRSFLQHPR